MKIDGARLEETYLSYADVSSLAVEFLDDTLLHNCCQGEVVGKLVEAGILTEEMIREYVAELEDSE